MFVMGTCPSTTCSLSDVYFPERTVTTFIQPPRFPHGPPSWHGSILESGQDASGYQYERNRYYDPGTGRFSEEDPIGLAGGLNLYGFANGDPVNFSDPFGLRVCFVGSTFGERETLRKGAEDATNSTIEVDEQGCVQSWQMLDDGKGKFHNLQETFGRMVGAEDKVFKVSFGAQSHMSDFGWATIRADDIGGSYPLPLGGEFCELNPSGHWTLGAIIAHELLGHGKGLLRGFGKGNRTRNAIPAENEYHAARGQDARCNARPQ